MADPVTTVLSLNTLASEYSVFERDQVLTERQLNSLARYLDDQDRLTRVALLGVGLVGGLRVSVVADKVKVKKGLGVTTDGDLLLLASDTTYDGVKAYDESAPRYEPFYSGEAGSMLPLWELVSDATQDVTKLPLSALPAALTDFTVCLYMESYEQDHDLCNAADCDNSGVSAMHTLRVLLVPNSEAPKLNAVFASVGSVVAELPRLDADRPKLHRALDSTGKLAALYRASCNATHAQLVAQLATLNRLLPEFVADVFGDDPTLSFTTRLEQLNRDFAGRDAGIQYYYAFLQDVVATWNDVREALVVDDSILCPDFSAFPKHLLVGSLNGSTQLRAEFYPSVVSAEARAGRSQAADLARKLQSLLASVNFTEPSVVVLGSAVVQGDEPGKTETRNILGSVRITPSSDASSSEERAIPFYYGQNNQFPILPNWNHALGRKKSIGRVTGYRWAEYNSSAAPDFFARQLGRYNLFRIEGHLGQQVNDVAYTLEQDIEKHNLPLRVVSVLLHNDKKKIVRRPPRYTDLHRVHYLLRRDVESQLKLSRDDNTRFRAAALSAAPESSDSVNRHSELIEQNMKTASVPLRATRYATYRQNLTSANGNWKRDYQVAAESVGAIKQGFGERVRADYASPFDGVISNNQNQWVDWLDTIIGARDELADGKLLLTGFFADHPGLEHQGGVPRGGTFILVYDDKGIVVADFALPYRVEEKGEPEADEPELKIPERRPVDVVDLHYKVIEPLDIRFARELKSFETVLEPKWTKEITIQQGYAKFFQESLGSMTDILGKTNSNVRDFAVAIPATNDVFLDAQVADVQATTARVDRLRKQIAKGDLEKETADKLTAKLASDEQLLSQLITDTTRHMVESKTDVSAGKPAADALQLLGESAIKVKDAVAVQGMTRELENISSNAAASERNIVVRLEVAGGLRRN